MTSSTLRSRNTICLLSTICETCLSSEVRDKARFANVASISRSTTTPVEDHYNIVPAINIYGAVDGKDLGYIHIPLAGAWTHPDPSDLDLLTFAIFEGAFVCVCAAYLFGASPRIGLPHAIGALP